MKTTIYLVRHGAVENPGEVIYGRMPGFPLSSEGREQAHRLGRRLSDKKISAIYASPLARTRETAGIISSFHKNIAIHFDERLLEVHSPGLEGKPFADIARDSWNFYKPRYVRQFGGERLIDIWMRMREFISESALKHRGQEIVVVSHGDPIMIVQAKHRGRRLVLGEIRGPEYVGTAQGIQLDFSEFGAVEVSKIDLQ
ncbi:histidine phosphatase family protein [Candidatus Gottesmanbacteria bacterium]|nr:histidine phosphatase family protein [Candidatus Gottesmanbacteria bacterium]